MAWKRESVENPYVSVAPAAESRFELSHAEAQSEREREEVKQERSQEIKRNSHVFKSKLNMKRSDSDSILLQL